MILNKSSFERGFAHASVYKSVTVDLVDEKRKDKKHMVFCRPKKEEIAPQVGLSLSLELRMFLH
jgi:hypothetical protein